MANRKDFTAINTDKADTGVNSGAVFAQAERGKSAFQQQGTASLEEQRERASAMRTQGRKGCRAVRINLAFSPENHLFVKVMSNVTGMTMTEFVNTVLAQYRDEHPEIYEQAKSILESVRGGTADEDG